MTLHLWQDEACETAVGSEEGNVIQYTCMPHLSVCLLQYPDDVLPGTGVRPELRNAKAFSFEYFKIIRTPTNTQIAPSTFTQAPSTRVQSPDERTHSTISSIRTRTVTVARRTETITQSATIHFSQLWRWAMPWCGSKPGSQHLLWWSPCSSRNIKPRLLQVRFVIITTTDESRDSTFCRSSSVVRPETVHVQLYQDCASQHVPPSYLTRLFSMPIMSKTFALLVLSSLSSLAQAATFTFFTHTWVLFLPLLCQKLKPLGW